MATTSLADLTIDRFHPIVGDAFYHGETGGGNSEWWMKGGRGSTKSSAIGLIIATLIMRYPYANAVVVRRFKDTLRGSVYNQMLWAIQQLGAQRLFHATVSPMEITYLPTGQKIAFRGLDDPLKAKGVKFTVGYCAIQWFEELDQMDSWQDVASALRSFKRGGSTFWTFYSYNPPRTMWSWVNERAEEMRRKPGCVVDASSYLDVVASGHADWLGGPFIEDAEYEREANPEGYRWEFLGEVTGTGGNVFGNVVARRVTDEEIATFDNPRNGVDWGWWPDPWRFVRCEFQAAQRRLIVFDELSANKQTPAETAQLVRARLTWPDPRGRERFHNQAIWCDSAEQTSIATYRREGGLNARPARKGNMRRASYLWLAGLREIVIDPDRCPLAYDEFRRYEHGRDRSGRWTDDFPDGNDHSIDAVRYAVMEDVLRGR